MRRNQLIRFALLLCSLSASAQEHAYTKNPAIGVYYAIFDFKAVKDGQLFNSANMLSGLAVSYLNGISPHFDWASTIAGTYADYPLNSGQVLAHGALLLEGDVAVNAKLFTDKHLISPYLSAGLGISEYSNYYGMLAPLGLGVQVNFSNLAYLLINAQYRIGVTSQVSNHLFYSLGLAGNIKKRKIQKPVVRPEIPVKEMNTDRDGDGVPDSLDKCPGVAGLKQLHGCPDSDGDGIADDMDQCPMVAGVAAYQGCPVPDSDNDGINDLDDSCKTIPGIGANHGCPLVVDTLSRRLAADAENIYFKTASWELSTKSYTALNDIIKILNQHPTVRISIKGHTDHMGGIKRNLLLSQNRAHSVQRYLETIGHINQNRLTAAGFGSSKPIDTNATAEGRARNRRVGLEMIN